jgi:cytosine deaminase
VTLLRSTTLADGSAVDVRLDGGRVSSVGLPGVLEALPEDERHDLTGFVLLPAPAEPHAHLDKAFTADRVRNPAGDLPGAIDAWIEYRAGLSVEDIRERARAAVLRCLGNGTTAIRSHVDVGDGIELRGAEAVLGLKEELAGLVHLEVAALVSRPVTGVEGAENRAFLRAAIELGVDLVGGAPHVDPDPPGALRFCLETAADLGRPVDLHMDETLNPAMLGLEDLTRLVAEGFPYPVTASHCVSLGVQPAAVQVRVAEAVAAAGISVVALPQTNLYLQGRGLETSPPRAMTAIRTLLAAGATVAAGGDNVQDVFNLMGRGDPLETAGLLVTAGHLSVEQAYALVSRQARAVLGLPTVDVAAEDPADLLAVAAGSLREAVATAPEDRMVFAGGRLVARSRVERFVVPVAPVAPGPMERPEALAWP